MFLLLCLIKFLISITSANVFRAVHLRKNQYPLRRHKQRLEPAMNTTANVGSGSGSSLPTVVLLLSGISALVAVLVSTMSILLQLKSYRKPVLQRHAPETNNRDSLLMTI